MLLNEARGKRLLAAAGIAVPVGIEITTPAAVAGARFAFPVAVKAQVASGGRGLAGGVRRCNSEAEVSEAAAAILSTRFSGLLPSTVLVEPWLAIARELYLSVVIDGRAGGFVVLYAPKGGVDIETGPKPLAYPVGLARNFRAHVFRALLESVEHDRKLLEQIVALARRLLRLAEAADCTTIEINPLAVLADGSLTAADAKIVRDDAAAWRHADIATALEQARAAETEDVRRCLDANLMLVWLEGEVGLLSGGAGMTMAAMDAIEAAGGHAACFLDCSGNPTPAGFGLALELLDSNPTVRSILVSMFGGGLQMDRVARTLIELLRNRSSTKPLVLRLDGTRGDVATTLLADAGFANHRALGPAVSEAVRLAQETTP